MSANRIFADMVKGLLPALDLGELAARLFLMGGLTWLAFGYLSGFGQLVLLSVNPDGQIARANLARATPLNPAEQCRLTRELRRHWDSEVGGDWRSWNLSEVRARRLIGRAPVGALSPTGCPDLEDQT